LIFFLNSLFVSPLAAQSQPKRPGARHSQLHERLPQPLCLALRWFAISQFLFFNQAYFLFLPLSPFFPPVIAP
jgi:hypothetical protein